jgi:hypothetical protein
MGRTLQQVVSIRARCGPALRQLPRVHWMSCRAGIVELRLQLDHVVEQSTQYQDVNASAALGTNASKSDVILAHEFRSAAFQFEIRIRFGQNRVARLFLAHTATHTHSSIVTTSSNDQYNSQQFNTLSRPRIHQSASYLLSSLARRRAGPSSMPMAVKSEATMPGSWNSRYLCFVKTPSNSPACTHGEASSALIDGNTLLIFCLGGAGGAAAGPGAGAAAGKPGSAANPARPPGCTSKE